MMINQKSICKYIYKINNFWITFMDCSYDIKTLQIDYDQTELYLYIGFLYVIRIILQAKRKNTCTWCVHGK